MNITYKQVPPRLHMQVKDLLNALGIHNEDPLNIHFGLLASKHSVCAYDTNDNGEEKLIAIARALDDTCYSAYLDYVIIHPDYRHKKNSHRNMHSANSIIKRRNTHICST